MKLRLFILTLFITTLGFAQSKGTISGVITDKDSNNETLPFANVNVKGTKVNATTDIDGKYSISIAPGDYIVQFSFVGYEPKDVPVKVTAGAKIEMNQALSSGAYALKDVVVTTTVNRQKETALLLEQKNAVEIKQAIGAQELSRKGVSDVATAVTKTTGITKQEGSGNIFVRGLGDRYNSTTMNGLPIPSNDPTKKNLNLDIFSTDIVEYISIDKVYSGKFYGDFAGGNVDIVSKEHKGKNYLKLELGSKVNTNALKVDNFSLLKGYGNLGFTNRSIPSNPLTQYNYQTNQLENKTPVATSFNISGGASFNAGDEGKISVFATISHDNEFTSKSNGSTKGSVSGTGVANKNFNSYTDISYNTNSTGLFNLGYKINTNNKINFNSLFINTSSLSKKEYTGFFVDGGDDGNALIRRNEYQKNNLLINQLLGEHTFNETSKFHWGLSYNTIKGDTPDRITNTLNKVANGYTLLSRSAGNNNRYFQSLKEDEAAANLSYDYKFKKDKEGEFKGKFTFGYSGRLKNRNFKATQFNFKSDNAHLSDIVDPNNLDLFYNQTNLNNNYFKIITFRGDQFEPTALDPQFYDGEQSINAAFINTEYKFNKLVAVFSLRGEQISQKITWNTQLYPVTQSSKLNKTAFLPSAILKYELAEKQNLRLGLSKTYTLPQFKERAPFLYEEITQVYIGNKDLYASDDYNLDLKWEFFPKDEELISVTAFGKYIQNPMNEITINSSTNDISYVNTGDYGYVTGAEVEYRKLLLNIDTENSKKLSAGVNLSYLYSNQELNSEKVKKETDFEVDFTNKKGKFTGASNVLFNADLSFFNEWNEKKNNLTSTLAYSYFSDRVYAIGTLQRGDIVDKAFGTLDFIAKSKLGEKLGLNFMVKNILNPTINQVQENLNGDINLLSYKKGLTASISINYQF
ncbi:TonB-dependent receptor [Flavobacterium glycines]|uniref:Collagen-binding protein n=1 Tax=Flavobacterium glycines TaxID=551990 RepID=A0A1B9DSA6_9FLAO|nr:TonB-dependent receptor [Flavobacterium glycines]OCB72577.1 TonB-dependent receptor [Flavobacterium glycines]GEL10072.1 collagen-binding protein [Flavobacterium glycines]SDI82591.1 TonB-dependent receptor [Flavobacterium glycines]